MQETKAFASLSSALLARKGQARPASRSIVYADQDAPLLADKALPPEHQNAPDRIEVSSASSTASPASALRPGAKPRTQGIVRNRVGKRTRADASPSDKAAFTLRLDAERHLKLRLASAHANQSAQQIVCAALDKYLADYAPALAGGDCPCRNLAQRPSGDQA